MVVMKSEPMSAVWVDRGDTADPLGEGVGPIGGISAPPSPETPGCLTVRAVISRTSNITWKSEEAEGVLFSG